MASLDPLGPQNMKPVLVSHSLGEWFLVLIGELGRHLQVTMATVVGTTCFLDVDLRKTELLLRGSDLFCAGLYHYFRTTFFLVPINPCFVLIGWTVSVWASDLVSCF